MNQVLCGKQRNLISGCLSACSGFRTQRGGGDAPVAGSRGAACGGELVEPALGCGKERAELAVVTSRGVFPGHQRAQPPWLPLLCQPGQRRCLAVCLLGKHSRAGGEAVCHSTDLAALKAPSKCLLRPAALCSGLRWGFLPRSSFFSQPSEVHRNILTALPEVVLSAGWKPISVWLSSKKGGSSPLCRCCTA